MLRYSMTMLNYRTLSGDAFLKLPLTSIVSDENAERTEQILF